MPHEEAPTEPISAVGLRLGDAGARASALAGVSRIGRARGLPDSFGAGVPVRRQPRRRVGTDTGSNYEATEPVMPGFSKPPRRGRIAPVPAPFVHRLRVRYHECDAQGIVFNANWFAYFDVALTELWRDAFGSYQALVDDGSDVVVAKASAHFRASGRFDDELDIALAIERLGTTAMTTAATARRGGEVLVQGCLVHVFVDPATLVKQEIPEHVRAALAPYVIGR